MYKIEKRPSGFLLTFSGFIDETQMQQWYGEASRLLTDSGGAFGVVVDMRTLKPLAPAAQAVMVKGQQLFRERGMQRSAVVLDNSITAAQFKRLAQESGIYSYERYFDASNVPNWQQRSIDWVKSGIDPDK